ncbi:hypothetical protein J7S33_21490 [Saccharothrix algeriensis]|uniref:Uncharacterized protein n=1 Tax=Saccharothrix algeriensis TaxID=173560 RepID=A0A8T8HTH0_9PSEU|nr:hypothetical protein J7S33_21490 [Saccharothrix algeriensis]
MPSGVAASSVPSSRHVSGTQSSSPSSTVARASGIHGGSSSRVSGAAVDAVTRRAPELSCATTTAHPARMIFGTPSVNTSRPPAGSSATTSTSSSSRWVSSTPAYGRTASTSTPSTDSAAVISTSGSRPEGSSTTRSSMARPAPRSTTSTLRMSAPVSPIAEATAPRAPGRSGSWTRIRKDTVHASKGLGSGFPADDSRRRGFAFRSTGRVVGR